MSLGLRPVEVLPDPCRFFIQGDSLINNIVTINKNLIELSFRHMMSLKFLFGLFDPKKKQKLTPVLLTFVFVDRPFSGPFVKALLFLTLWPSSAKWQRQISSLVFCYDKKVFKTCFANCKFSSYRDFLQGLLENLFYKEYKLMVMMGFYFKRRLNE